MNKRLLNESLHYQLKELSNSSFIKKIFWKIKIYVSQCIFRKAEIPYLEFFITTKCTLRCVNCSNLIPSISGEHLTYEAFTYEIDNLLSKINCLYRLKLHGGEVFLNKDFPLMLEYVANQKKIKSIRVTTNGSIIPNESILIALKAANAVVQISDYDITKDKRSKLIDTLKEHNIRYAYLKNQVWYDMGNFEKRKVNCFNKCSIKRCTSFYDGKIFVCSRAAIMNKLGVIQSDYVDVHLNKREFKKALRCFYNNNFPIACYHCDGDTNKHGEIQPGLQVK